MATRDHVNQIVGATAKMLWGSLGAVYRRCGRKGCHCATGDKHGPVFYLTRSAAGRTYNIYVPPELRAEVEEGVARPTAVIESWARRLQKPTRGGWDWARIGASADDPAPTPAAQYF